MTIITAMAVLMGMFVVMRVAVLVRMIMRMAVAMIAFAAIRQMHIKLHPINRTFLPAISAKGIALELEFF